MGVLDSNQNLRAAGSALHELARGITGRPTFHGRVGVWAVGKHHIHVLQLHPLQGSFQSWGKNRRSQLLVLLDPPWAWLWGQERDEGRLVSCRALGR